MPHDNPITLLRPGPQGPIILAAGKLCDIGVGPYVQIVFEDAKGLHQPLAQRCQECGGYYIYKEASHGCPRCNQAAYLPVEVSA
jgi:hypothetical protein